MRARAALLGVAILTLPVSARGAQWLYAEVPVPILDNAGNPVYDDGRPAGSAVCAVWLSNYPGMHQDHARLADRTWLRGATYDVDPASRVITVTHVWVWNIVSTPETVPLGGTGYMLAGPPTEIDYPVSLSARMLPYPPSNDCNWQALIDNTENAIIAAEQSQPSGGEGGGSMRYVCHSVHNPNGLGQPQFRTECGWSIPLP